MRRIQLKRFADLNKKIQKKIEISDEIDLSPYISKNESLVDEPVKYKLVSIVSHRGLQMRSGHYTTNAFKKNGTFYLFDDSNVRKIRFDPMFLSNSYLLFYELVKSSPIKIKETIQSLAAVPSHHLRENLAETMHSFSTEEIENGMITKFTNVDITKPNQKPDRSNNLHSIENTAYVPSRKNIENLSETNVLEPHSLPLKIVDHSCNGKFKFEYVEEPKKLLIEESDWLHIFDQTTEEYITCIVSFSWFVFENNLSVKNMDAGSMHYAAIKENVKWLYSSEEINKFSQERLMSCKRE